MREPGHERVTDVDEGRRWWDAAAVAAAIVVAVVIWFDETPPGAHYAGVLILLAVFLAAYFALGRRARQGTAAALIFQLILVACMIAGAWFAPNFLTLQVIVLPLIWTTTRTIRAAVIFNVVIAAGTTVAFGLGIGGTLDAFAEGGTIEVLSLAFSIALGLWITRVHEYGEERARLLAELTAAQGKLELLNRDAGAIAERERLAREVHDTIAQSLTGLVMLAERARREESGAQVEGHAAQLEETLSLIETMAREALGDARALVATAAGIPDDDRGLAGAMVRLAERFRRETGIEVEVDAYDGALPRDVEVVLLRTAQEGLANVRKHSGASRVVIRFARTDDVVTLTVADDGRGPGDYDAGREQGFGIAGMRDRIRLVDGSLELADGRGGGAVLTARIPLADPDRGAPSEAAPGIREAS